MTAATTRTAAQILRVLPRERITRLLGHLGAARLPQPVLRPFLSAYQRAYRVDMHEAVVPDGGFQSFNEFFTRRVRDGVHRVDAREAVVVSPADGRLDDHGPIDDARRFVVKGNDYNAAELLGDEAEAADFAGGHFAVVYLSPWDYHRVHSPVAGRVRRVRPVRDGCRSRGHAVSPEDSGRSRCARMGVWRASPWPEAYRAARAEPMGRQLAQVFEGPGLPDGPWPAAADGPQPAGVGGSRAV